MEKYVQEGAKEEEDDDVWRCKFKSNSSVKSLGAVFYLSFLFFGYN
jgi:hypothetical protein